LKRTKLKQKESEESSERGEKMTTREQCYIIVPRKDLISKKHFHKSSSPMYKMDHQAHFNKTNLTSENDRHANSSTLSGVTFCINLPDKCSYSRSVLLNIVYCITQLYGHTIVFIVSDI
jgi:hypothetical protein